MTFLSTSFYILTHGQHLSDVPANTSKHMPPHRALSTVDGCRRMHLHTFVYSGHGPHLAGTIYISLYLISGYLCLPSAATSRNTHVCSFRCHHYALTSHWDSPLGGGPHSLSCLTCHTSLDSCGVFPHSTLPPLQAGGCPHLSLVHLDLSPTLSALLPTAHCLYTSHHGAHPSPGLSHFVYLACISLTSLSSERLLHCGGTHCLYTHARSHFAA